MLKLIFFVAWSHVVVTGKLVQYVFQAKYHCGAPDGVTVCHILGVNGQFPGPTIKATIGDTVRVTLINLINNNRIPYPRDTGAAIHYHGITQNSTPFEDGPDGVTQCPIPAGNVYTYEFPLKQAGTYWWHSHFTSQLSEGMWGRFIVHNEQEVYRNYYDDELYITLSDWYHTSGQQNTDYYLSPQSQGAVPFPDSILMNGRGMYHCNLTNLPCDPKKQVPEVIKVQRGKSYRIRVVNACAYLLMNFSIPGHKLVAIKTDGIDTVPVAFDSLVIHPGQRYSFIVTMNSTLSEKWIRAEGLPLDDLPPQHVEPVKRFIRVVRARLEYVEPKVPIKDELGKVAEAILHIDLNKKNPANPVVEPLKLENVLRPYNKIPAPQKVDQEIEMVMRDFPLNGVTLFALNNSTYKVYNEPLLSLVIKNAALPATSNPYVVGFNKVIQIVLNNRDDEPHPFHLHGHHFYVLGQGEPNEGDFNPKRSKISRNGERRDTLGVELHSWSVIRFVTDNPGAWMIHCHINWHLQSGLAAVIIEAPDQVRARYKIPIETIRICKSKVM